MAKQDSNTSAGELKPIPPVARPAAQSPATAPASVHAAAPGQVILGDFLVEGFLGQGGMGRVFLLRSQSTNHRFAVKVCRFAREDDRRNFLAELQTWIGLPEHPNLVACRFFRTLDDDLLIFAEYVEGGSLSTWIRERRLTHLAQVLAVAIQFA